MNLDPVGLAKKFENWLASDRRSRFLYWHGHLANDRVERYWGGGDLHNTLFERELPEIAALANLVYASHIAGKVILMQERIGPDEFNYWAFRRVS